MRDHVRDQAFRDRDVKASHGRSSLAELDIVLECMGSDSDEGEGYTRYPSDAGCRQQCGSGIAVSANAPSRNRVRPCLLHSLACHAIDMCGTQDRTRGDARSADRDTQRWMWLVNCGNHDSPPYGQNCMQICSAC
jgi:hypothetical protein